MQKKLHFLLADDDPDDRTFFEITLKSLSPGAKLETVKDGAELLKFLEKNKKHLPDVLFLDINMPKKNGAECLAEIKRNDDLKKLPVIMYSTSLHEDAADQFYAKGAHYYIQKGDLNELEKLLKKVIKIFSRENIARPSREEFIFKS
ncbi:MAG: response regulator rcp1 [Bacteroidota bacterium]|jgi:CheY-like chemotaxis protein|nr:response regulator rcp1 [Bacteroidota bacterium]